MAIIKNDSGVRARDIIIVPHSHWDREWYFTFEQFRFYLVRFMDELIEYLESDEQFKHFLLDGQMILLEDYLQIRPEHKDRLKQLIQDGRIDIGPWYVQPDEFLVSGEALVRNFLIGDRYARDFGPVMKQGYIPDTFGHTIQLPQILNGFGIHTFYFMRGLGENVDDLRSEFWWEAPDGSKVLAHFLSESYSNAALLHKDPEQMKIRHGKTVNYNNFWELKGRLDSRTDADALLLLNGNDHLTVQRDFTESINGLNDSVADRIYNGRLADFERNILNSNTPLQTLNGELRFGRYFPVLKDVISTRMYLKQYNEKAQQLLEGRAERYNALSSALGLNDYSAHLRYAWKELLKNHPHDSICGCSIDEVHREMITRYDKVIQLGEKIVEETLADLAHYVCTPAEGNEIPVVLFNPSPWERSDLVYVDVIPQKDTALGRRVFGSETTSQRIDLTQYMLVDEEGSAIPFRIVSDRLSGEDPLNRRKMIPRTTLEFIATAVPPMGHLVYRLIPRQNQAILSLPVTRSSDGSHSLENKYLKVIAENNGTLTVYDKVTGFKYKGMNQFVDDADAGDEYTYSPPLRQNIVFSNDLKWNIGDGQDPFSITLHGELELPCSLSADRRGRSNDTVKMQIICQVQLCPSDRRINIKIKLQNTAKDHRFRVLFPTEIRTEESIAETHFGIIRRPVNPENCEGWREKTSASYSQRRFVCAEASNRGLALLNKGLPEYELAPNGDLYLTLLRSVGWLSREDLITRPGHAGPAIETPDAQCIGWHTYEYAIVPYSGDVLKAQIHREAEVYMLPVEGKAVQGTRNLSTHSLSDSSRFLEIVGETIEFSAMKKAEDDGSLIIRLVNLADYPTTAEIRSQLPISTAVRTNLNEEDLEILEVQNGHVTLKLGPAKIETVRLIFQN